MQITRVYEEVSVESPDVSAEEKDPTCTEDVVCDYCGTVVKEATGHNVEEWYVNAEGHEQGECQNCLQTILR